MGMKSMYELRDMLCKELDELIRKGELGAGDLDIAHKLTDTIKTSTRSRRWTSVDIPGAIWTMICAATAVAAPMPVGITSEVITAARTQLSICAARSTI